MLMIKQQNNRETSQIQLAMTCHIMHRKYLTHSYKLPYAQVHPYLYSLSHLSVKICSCST